MAVSWLQVLLATNAVALPQRRDLIDERVAASFVLRGDSLEYRNLQGGGSTLPDRDDARWRTSPDRSLLTGLLNHVRGFAAEAEVRYRHTVEHAPDADTLAASVILLSISLVEDDRAGEALDLLLGTRDRLAERASVEGALVNLHIGFRLAELGEWSDAVAATEVTQVAVSDRAGGELVELIERSRRDNVLNFRLHAGGDVRFEEPAREPLPDALRWRLVQQAEAGDLVLDLRIRERLRDARSVGGFYSSPVTADQHLWAVAFHCERLASWGATRHARRALGRHRLAQAASAEPGWELRAESLQLVFDGGDSELGRVTRWFLRHGPAEDVAAFTRRVADRPWSSTRRQATLEVLANAGQLLAVDIADRSVEYLVEAIDAPNDQGFDHRHYGTRALAGVLPAASDRAHELAADLVLKLCADVEDERGGGRVRDVIRAIRWKATAAGTRARGRALVEAWATGHDETAEASALLVPLTRLRPSWGHQTALGAFERVPSPLHAALVLDTGGDPPAEVLASIIAGATAKIDSERAAAGGGRYSMAGINDALILTVALLRSPDPRPTSWGELANYLTDDNVMADPKAAVLDAITTAAPRLDDDVTAILRGAVRAGIAGLSMHADGGETLQGAVFRLALQLDEIDTTTARTHLVELMAALDPTLRLEAAWSLPLARRALPAGELFLLTLQVLEDHDAEVRAAASASAVAMLRGRGLGKDRGPHIVDLLARNLTHDGVAVPIAILSALRDTRVTTTLEPLAPVIAQVQTTTHSAIVRATASRILTTWTR